MSVVLLVRWDGVKPTPQQYKRYVRNKASRIDLHNSPHSHTHARW